MAIPTHSDFLHPFLEVLEKKSPIKRKDMMREMANHLALSSDDLELLTEDGGQTQYESRIDWCYQHLSWAGLMYNPKHGIWEITDEGREYLRTHTYFGENDLMKIPSFAVHNKGR